MRRRALLGILTAAISGFAGCGDSQSNQGSPTGNPDSTASTETETISRSSTPTAETRRKTPSPTATETSSPTPTASPTPFDRVTPPADFEQKWPYDDDDDWTEESRLSQYPESDEGYDWTPEFARTAKYTHGPTRDDLGSYFDDADATDVPPLRVAVASKWRFPEEFSKSAPLFVDEIADWFTAQFGSWPMNEVHHSNVHPYSRELDSGDVVGLHPVDGDGDTGEFESPFEATVDGESVVVKRITLDVKGSLYGLVDENERVGYSVAELVPEQESVTFHTVEEGVVDVTGVDSPDLDKLDAHLVEIMTDIARD